jgi:MerR family transcriptional regulator/heat shock protein HspR
MSNKVSDNNFIKNGMKSDMPLYTISVVSELLGTTNQTLRLYEKHNLIKPYRKNKNRLYSENDIKWLFCIREIIHNKKISIEGLKKLLNYAPCWEIKDCPEDKRKLCEAYKDKTKKCWELKKNFCSFSEGTKCRSCLYYIKSHRKVIN